MLQFYSFSLLMLVNENTTVLFLVHVSSGLLNNINRYNFSL